MVFTLGRSGHGSGSCHRGKIDNCSALCNTTCMLPLPPAPPRLPGLLLPARCSLSPLTKLGGHYPRTGRPQDPLGGIPEGTFSVSSPAGKVEAIVHRHATIFRTPRSRLYSRWDRRHSSGLVFVKRTKTREKWLWSKNHRRRQQKQDLRSNPEASPLLGLPVVGGAIDVALYRPTA